MFRSKKTLHVLWLAFIFLSITHPMRAQLTLPEMINRALEHNYQIQIFSNTHLAAQNANTAGNAGMLPGVDLSGEYRISLNDTEQRYFNGEGQSANQAKSTALTGNVGVNWMIFDGLAMFGRKEQLEHLEKRSEQDLKYYVEQTAFDIALNYFRLVQEQELLKLYRSSVEVSEVRLAFERQAFEVGSSTALDVQQALVDRNTDSSLVLDQIALIQEIEIELNKIMNRELTSSIHPADEILLSENFDLMHLLGEARTNNARLNVQQLDELIAISDYKIARGDLFPTVEVFGNYGYNRQNNEVGFLASSRQLGPNAGVRIRFNLFDGSRASIRARNIKIESESEQLRTRQLQQEVEASIRVSYLRWKSRLDQVMLEHQSVEAADKALAIAWKQFELGTITNIDFRIIQLNAVNAQSRLLSAQFAAKKRELELNLLSGNLLQKIL